jgi:hypothetical protein
MANYTKPHIFNIVLNSVNASPSSVDVYDLSFDFNWTNIPQGKYKMDFCYKGLNNADYVANDSPQVFLTLGSVPSVYQASGSDGSVVSTYIGSLRAETHAGGQVYFYSNLNDNPSVYFNSLPTSGPIQVQVYRSNFTTVFTTLAGSPLAQYVMVLTFVSIE